MFQLAFQDRPEEFDVRSFVVQEHLSSLFSVQVSALARIEDADLDTLVGLQVGFRMASTPDGVSGGRLWTGICTHAELLNVESEGVSRYGVLIEPRLWLLGQRCNYRVFQGLRAKAIVSQLLDEWGIESRWSIEEGRYPVLDCRVQYDETDLAFVARLLEESGISFAFVEHDDRSTVLLTDEPTGADPDGPALEFLSESGMQPDRPFATGLRRAARVRPGAVTLADYDFRRPSFQLRASPRPDARDTRLEQMRYCPGAAVVQGQAGGATPVADTRGAARADEAALGALAERMLAGQRSDVRSVSFDSNRLNLRPGSITEITGHPRRDLGSGRRLLVVGTRLVGGVEPPWHLTVEARFADTPLRPAMVTPRPVVRGLESAVVVGPAGQEIHADEHGRVRVQFLWDRQGPSDERSFAWIRVSQGWAGTGYGMVTIPRVGQEVLVGFLGGNPDAPIVVGRLYNAMQQLPYPLPEQQTVSTWKSQSTPGGDGFNELKFDDKKGQELLYLQAERDLRKLVKHDEHERTRRHRNVTVGANLTTHVGGDETREVTGRRRTCITGEDHRHVKADVGVREDRSRRHTIREHLHLFVGGEMRETVLGDVHVLHGSDRYEHIAGQLHLSTGVGEIHIKTQDRLTLAGADTAYLTAGRQVRVSSPTRLTLKVGASFIDMSPSGIDIVGPLIRINSGGEAPPRVEVRLRNPLTADEAPRVCGHQEDHSQGFDRPSGQQRSEGSPGGAEPRGATGSDAPGARAGDAVPEAFGPIGERPSGEPVSPPRPAPPGSPPPIGPTSVPGTPAVTVGEPPGRPRSR